MESDRLKCKEEFNSQLLRMGPCVITKTGNNVTELICFKRTSIDKILK